MLHQLEHVAPYGSDFKFAGGVYKYSAPTEVAGLGPYCDFVFITHFLTSDPIAYTYFILTVSCVALGHKSDSLSPTVYVVNFL
jgi:hypothetical protein